MNQRVLHYQKSTLTSPCQLTVIQQSESQTGGVIWDAALVLQAFLQKSAESAPHLFDKKFLPELHNANVLQLGSGTGFCGLSLLPFHCKNIILTDCQAQMDLMQKNIQINSQLIQSIEGCSCVSKRLDWTIKEDRVKIVEEYGGIDVVIASDIVFVPTIAKDLLQTLIFLMNSKQNRSETNPAFMLLSIIFRSVKDEEFFKVLECQKSIECMEVPLSLQDQTFQSDDIHVFVFKMV